jgi:hypothetical protein
VTRAVIPFLLPIAVGLTMVPVLPFATEAEHEVYYRYIVLGYVRDGRGNAVVAKRVELIRDKTGFSYLGETDTSGFFMIIARLGDESVGESLTLKVGSAQTAITARFDPANHRDHRGTRVDVESERFVERTASFRRTLGELLESPR